MYDVRMKNEKLSTAVVCAVCLAASVLLLGVSGTAALALVAYLRS
jgi:uncharacterized membrane protein